ncbi:hypothetical protein [Burkholderia ubonensis]|uniref:Uncharacterized protein n=1 Tax=Burkholderia ubonensis subsp. mesacidophila TaxID=265293 RepID=A0A2A4FK12_9BURK|nr:hypothetical protein [Burkholderia ubonensis]PCE32954.1 hypothetical protein BZL54_08265 [Burkholderia ubonensis subsp. mesacidophila]
MTIVLILVVLAIAALFGFAAHVDALTGRIGPQPARAQLERLRREGAALRAALRQGSERGDATRRRPDNVSAWRSAQKG